MHSYPIATTRLGTPVMVAIALYLLRLSKVLP
jgi:hypothetical protein